MFASPGAVGWGHPEPLHPPEPSPTFMTRLCTLWALRWGDVCCLTALRDTRTVQRISE